jgi:site-specific DNA-methyltransferase (adenine-specific)
MLGSDGGGPSDEKRLGRAAEIAAELCRVSPRYVYEARKLREADRSIFDEVRAGRMNLSRARVAVSKIQRAKAIAAPQKFSSAKKPTPADDWLIVGDCLQEMAKLPAGSFPLIFADPPYNLGWKYDADPNGDRLPDVRYQDWCQRWIGACARLLSPDGSMFLMIDARWQGRFDVMLRNAGQGGLFWRNTIVWHDTFPNHSDGNFQPAARFIHYFTRSAKNFAWNPDAVRVPSRRDELNDSRRAHDKGIVPHNVWDISRVQGNAADRVPFDDAPPQVPAAILERIILAASNPGDRVFDPFTGNGTTWRAARKLGRKFTGIERSEKYAAQARQWAMS